MIPPNTDNRLSKIGMSVAALCVCCLLILTAADTSGAAYSRQVFEIQQKLTGLGYDPGPIDGFWGNRTETALKTFQRNEGLVPSGKINYKTLERLGILTSKPSSISKTEDSTGYAKRRRGIPVKPILPDGSRLTGNQWLFVIGIDTYIGWPRLSTAVNDARSVRDILLSRYFFEPDHLIELYDERATRRNILNNLRYLARNVSENDSLVIFYAGHGHLDPITKEGSWIPVESGTKDVSAWISNHDIKNYLRVDAIKAKHILLISDSCFAGDFFRGHRGKLPEVTDGVIKRAYKLTSRQAMTSGGLEPVSDAGFGQNSIFSHFLITALKENQKPFLIPSDLFPYVKAGVAQNAEQFPQLGSLSGTGGQQGGELVLFLKQDA